MTNQERVTQISEPEIYCGTYRRVEDGEMLEGPLVKEEALKRLRDDYINLSHQSAREAGEYRAVIEGLEQKVAALEAALSVSDEEWKRGWKLDGTDRAPYPSDRGLRVMRAILAARLAREALK